MEFLPNDILRSIFGYIQYIQLGNIFRICKKFNKFSIDENFWKLRAECDFPKNTTVTSRKEYIYLAMRNGICYPGSGVHNYQLLYSAITLGMTNSIYLRELLKSLYTLKPYQVTDLIIHCFKRGYVELAKSAIVGFGIKNSEVLKYLYKYYTDSQVSEIIELIMDTHPWYRDTRTNSGDLLKEEFTEARILYNIETGKIRDWSRDHIGKTYRASSNIIKYAYMHGVSDILAKNEYLIYQEIAAIILTNTEYPDLAKKVKQLTDDVRFTEILDAIIEMDRVDLLPDFNSSSEKLHLWHVFLYAKSNTKILTYLLTKYNINNVYHLSEIVERATIHDIQKLIQISPYLNGDYRFPATKDCPIFAQIFRDHLLTIPDKAWAKQRTVIDKVFRYDTVPDLISAVQYHHRILLVKKYIDLGVCSEYKWKVDVERNSYPYMIYSKYILFLQDNHIQIKNMKHQKVYGNIRKKLEFLVEKGYFGIFIQNRCITESENRKFLKKNLEKLK